MDIDVSKIIAAAENGGKVVKEYFGKMLEIEQKSTLGDLRTKADTESERAILHVLQTEYPDYNIYSEEVGHIEKKSEYTFVIDPLDGSNNFILGIPTFMVSIGVVKDNEIIAGVIHNPILYDTYHAQKGKGAFLGNKKLHVNTESNIANASVSYTCNYINSSEFEEKLIHRFHEKKLKRYLSLWCPTADLCMLASGKIEGVINNKTELYDYCAGKIIAMEAGATVTDFEGNDEKNNTADAFVISNGTNIHKELLEVMH